MPPLGCPFSRVAEWVRDFILTVFFLHHGCAILWILRDSKGVGGLGRCTSGSFACSTTGVRFAVSRRTPSTSAVWSQKRFCNCVGQFDRVWSMSAVPGHFQADGSLRTPIFFFCLGTAHKDRLVLASATAQPPSVTASRRQLEPNRCRLEANRRWL